MTNAIIQKTYEGSGLSNPSLAEKLLGWFGFYGLMEQDAKFGDRKIVFYTFGEESGKTSGKT